MVIIPKCSEKGALSDYYKEYHKRINSFYDMGRRTNIAHYKYQDTSYNTKIQGTTSRYKIHVM